jgi:hypothetical protein
VYIRPTEREREREREIGITTIQLFSCTLAAVLLSEYLERKVKHIFALALSARVMVTTMRAEQKYTFAFCPSPAVRH